MLGLRHSQRSPARFRVKCDFSLFRESRAQWEVQGVERVLLLWLLNDECLGMLKQVEFAGSACVLCIWAATEHQPLISCHGFARNSLATVGASPPVTPVFEGLQLIRAVAVSSGRSGCMSSATNIHRNMCSRAIDVVACRCIWCTSSGVWPRLAGGGRNSTSRHWPVGSK